MTSSNTPLRSSVKVLNLFVTSLYSRSSEDQPWPFSANRPLQETNRKT